jgi:hypothetical protein
MHRLRSVNINDATLRGKQQNTMRDLLLKRLHNRYQFPSPYNKLDKKKNLVNEFAICKFTKALANWKYRTRHEFRDKDIDEVQATFPMITNRTWRSSESIAKTQWS